MNQSAIEPTRVCALGTAWAGSSVNCKSYACDAVVSWRHPELGEGYAGAFYDASGNVVLYFVPRDGDDARTLAAFPTPPPHDAHFTPSAVVDGEGRLHVMLGAHVSRPIWIRQTEGDAPGFVNASDDLPDALDAVTYPSFLRAPSGSVHLIYRLGYPARSMWRICDWDAGTGRWVDHDTIISGIAASGEWSAGPYLSPPFSMDETSFGIFYVWRSEAVSEGRRNPRNIGVDFLRLRTDDRACLTAAGMGLSRPVTPANSERVFSVPWGADLSNQSGACMVGGVPCFAANWRAPDDAVRQIHMIWCKDGGGWRHRKITDLRTDARMAGTGTLSGIVSRPVIVPAGETCAVLLFRSHGRLYAVAQDIASGQTGGEVVLVADDLGQYEPTVLRDTSDGRLVMFVQSVTQNNGDDEVPAQRSEACLMAWNMEDICRVSIAQHGG